MFKELMPLLSQRMVIITLFRVSDDEICINVIPKPLKSDQQGDDALTIPLRVTGTSKELDEQLPGQLVEFVETHLELSSTLKSAKEQMEAAAKAAREAARKSTNSKSHGGSSRSATSHSTQAQDETSGPESEANKASGDVGLGTGTGTGNLFEAENNQ